MPIRKYPFLHSGLAILVVVVALSRQNQVVVPGIGPGGSLAVPAACGGGRVRVFLSDVSEPADLLDLEELGKGGVRGVAALDFDVVSVANGGESEFLPEVYRPFFKPGE